MLFRSIDNSSAAITKANVSIKTAERWVERERMREREVSDC